MSTTDSGECPAWIKRRRERYYGVPVKDILEFVDPDTPFEEIHRLCRLAGCFDERP